MSDGNGQVAVAIRPEVQTFAGMMEEILAENDWKTSWKTAPLDNLFSKLKGEVSELDQALQLYRTSTRIFERSEGKSDHYRRLLLMNKQKHRQEAIKECVDVANFAMMVADNLLREIEQEAANHG